MKKTFSLVDLDCANCAAKMEQKIAKIDGVQSVTVSFFAQKLILEADDARWDEIVKQACDAVHKVDADCQVIVK